MVHSNRTVITEYNNIIASSYLQFIFIPSINILQQKSYFDYKLSAICNDLYVVDKID